MRTTIKDVAKRVGVTPATVSMVMNGSMKISKITKDKVMRAAGEMNYRPNFIGRSLVKGKTNNIVVISEYFSSLFAVEAIRGVEDILRKNGYNMLLYSTSVETEIEAGIVRQLFLGGSADGVILLDIFSGGEVLEEFGNEGVPVIFVEGKVHGADGVVFDNHKGAYMGTNHLIKTKRKKIGIILQDGGISSEDRLAGYKAALKKAKIQFNEKLIFRASDDTASEGEKALKELFKKNKGMDAVFSAIGDIAAMGVIKQAKAMKIKIPKDIALVGFDDIYMAAFSNPGLTTIRQPMCEMGKRAAKMIVERIAEDRTKGWKTEGFLPELIIREST